MKILTLRQFIWKKKRKSTPEISFLKNYKQTLSFIQRIGNRLLIICSSELKIYKVGTNNKMMVIFLGSCFMNGLSLCFGSRNAARKITFAIENRSHRADPTLKILRLNLSCSKFEKILFFRDRLELQMKNDMGFK